VLAWVAAFLAVAGVISRRDHRGFDVAERVRVHEDSVRVLLDIRAQVSADVARLLSPGEITRYGQALGLRLPSDSEITTLHVPAP
jgi:hypothetical protein